MRKSAIKYLEENIYDSRGWRGLIALFSLSAIVIGLFFRASSPLIDPLYSMDSACFFIIGKGWAEGHLPYIDYFDHKGPLLYAFYALSYLIGGTSKWGMFFLQCLLFGWTLWMLKDIAHKLQISPKAFFVSLTIFLIYCIAWGHEPQTEFFCLPFQVLALWVFTRSLNRDEPGDHKYIDTFVYGIAMGAIALIRINNACLNVAIIIVLTFVYLRRRKYIQLLCHALVFLGGLVLIVLPFISYFYYNDALDDLIYCNWTFNLKYKTVNIHSSIRNAIFMLPVVLASCYAFWKYRAKQPYSLISLTSFIASIIIFAVYINGATYVHYFLILAPLIFIDFALICENRLTLLGMGTLFLCLPDPLKFATKSFLGAMAVCSINHKAFVADYGLMNYDSQCERLDNILRHIPIDERSSIYCDDAFDYEEIFQQADIIPVNKYFNIPKLLIRVDPSISDSISSFIDKTQPIWILTSNTPSEEIKNILKDYRSIDSISLEKPLIIYRRKTDSLN